MRVMVDVAVGEIDGSDFFSVCDRVNVQIGPPQFKVPLDPCLVGFIWHEQIT